MELLNKKIGRLEKEKVHDEGSILLLSEQLRSRGDMIYSDSIVGLDKDRKIY